MLDKLWYTYHMITILLTMLLTTAGTFIALMGVVFLLKRQLTSWGLSYFQVKTENQTNFERLIDSITTQQAQKIILHISQSTRGQASVESKNVARLETAALQDTLTAQNPLMGALASMPQVSALVSKNKGVQALIMKFLDSKAGSGQAPDNGQTTELNNFGGF